MRVLLVEDDPALADGICTALRMKGVVVEWVDTASAAHAELASPLNEYDAVILDLTLPDGDGRELLNHYRETGGGLPVLILTAHHDVEDRVAGLDAGADDYLGKPFDIEELTARLRALHRRRQGRAIESLQHGGLRFDPLNNEAIVNGVSIGLPRRESMLLRLLLENRGRIVTTEAINNHLYSPDESVESNALAVHVHNLRRRLGRSLIETVRGVGYRIPRESK